MADPSGSVPITEALTPREVVEIREIMEKFRNRSLSIRRDWETTNKPYEGLGQTSFVQRILIRDENNNRILIGRFD